MEFQYFKENASAVGSVSSTCLLLFYGPRPCIRNGWRRCYVNAVNRLAETGALGISSGTTSIAGSRPPDNIRSSITATSAYG